MMFVFMLLFIVSVVEYVKYVDDCLVGLFFVSFIGIVNDILKWFRNII